MADGPAQLDEAAWEAIMRNWPYRLGFVVTPQVSQSDGHGVVTTAWASPDVETVRF